MKKIWIFMLKIAIAVLIVAYLIHVHYNSFINGLQKFNPVWLPAAVSVLLFEMVFCAWPRFRKRSAYLRHRRAFRYEYDW